MPRPLFDSEYLFGLHEPGGEQLMLDAGRPGWVLFTEEVGRNPNDFSGKDFSPWSNRNLGVICRINHGYHPNGTIPNSAYYEDFARRCANYVANSQGCKIWIIGNETNFDVERPSLIGRGLASPAQAAQARSAVAGSAAPPAPEQAPPSEPVLTRLLKAFFRSLSGGMGDAELFPQPAPPPAAAEPQQQDDPLFHGDPRRFNALLADTRGAEMVAAASPTAVARGAARAAPAPSEVITPELYARCYRLCRDAIRGVPGHANDQVLIGAVAPWNNQTQYAGNPNGDWVQYLQDILRLLGPTGCDGITLHTYTHGADPNLIHDAAKMNPPFQNRHYHFFAYRDFMNAIPTNMRHLPVYITETDEDVAWLDQNIGWVQRAYAEINWWNNQPGNQQIRALILYRWPNIDRWVIETKPGVIADFRDALRNDYRWKATQTPAPGPSFKTGDSVLTTTVVNVRRTPGTANKPANDILIALPLNSTATVVSGPRTVDNLIWWQLRGTSAGSAFDGWAAEIAPTGQVLLELNGRGVVEPPPPIGKFKTGDVVVTQTIVRLRRTPGITNKPANDVIADINQGVHATINSGPQSADALTWWRVATTNPANAAVTGWLAESAPGGVVLIEKAPGGGTTPPPSGSFARGELVTTTTIVRVRRTPGTVNKPENDTLGAFDPRTTLNVIEGPRTADGLTWWRVGGITLAAGEVIGWVAEKDQTGAVLVGKPSKLPGTNIPDRVSGAYLGLPFVGNFGISQLWGENPQIYGKISYDGVPLKGHNGIDFLTPTGTTLLAIEGGVVQEAVHNDPSGFGHFIKLRHSWGESLYAHLDSIAVQAGQSVSRGQTIGRSGNTGFSDGPHLHFAIRINPYSRTDGWGGFSDPLPYMNPSQIQLPGYLQDGGARAAQSVATARSARSSLGEAPGYAPDQPGVARP